MPLINCENNLILTLLANCVVSEGDKVTLFVITDTKLYIPVVTLSTYKTKQYKTTATNEIRIQMHN